MLSGLQMRVGALEADCVNVYVWVKNNSVDSGSLEAAGQQIGQGTGHLEP